MSEPTLAAWLGRLAAVGGSGAGVRRALWGAALAGRPPGEAARLVDAVVRLAATGEPAAVAAYLPLVDLPAVAAAAGPGALAAVLLAARERDLAGCLLLLEHPGPPAAAEPGSPPDPELERWSLGERRALARGVRGPRLQRLLADPEPRVVAELLRNPRLREWEVVAIASRRPCPEAVFGLLAASEVWVRRPAVRRAMVLNPHAPPRLALALAVLLTGPELAEVAQRERLHPAVRDGAVQIRGWRHGA